MAKLIYISKYPPLEGGIAAKTFWLAQALADSGHAVHIITDPINADPNYSIAEANQPPKIPGVFVHRADQSIPWHIPQDNHRTISLVDKALEIIDIEKPDLIVAGYLVPYGIVAFQVSRITGIPFVLCHGGSDIHKFLLNNVWPTILPKTLAAAKLIITDEEGRLHIERYSSRVKMLPPYVPDPTAFNIKQRPTDKYFTLAMIGKSNFYWRDKGWQQIIDICTHLGDEFILTIVTQGVGLEDFKKYASEVLGDRVVWRSFVPPWKMPDLLKSINGLFHFQNKLPFPMFSNLVLESLACGTVVISDTPDLLSIYQKHGIDLSSVETQILSLPVDKPKKAAMNLTRYFSQETNGMAWNSSPDFNTYINSFERGLLDSLSGS
jgi:glycosyltransferase involved in cell wall biosynthesis